jgi:hypothetical protein
LILSEKLEILKQEGLKIIRDLEKEERRETNPLVDDFEGLIKLTPPSPEKRR